MADPIWKDHFTSLGSVASQFFRIKQSGTVIYSGRAFRPTSSGTLYVRINDVCADYMAQRPASVPGGNGTQVTFPMSFTVEKSSNGVSWSSVETVSFNDDWSYDASFDPSSLGMAFPITGRVDLRQVVYQTRYASGSVTASCKYGTTSRSVTLSLETTPGNTAFGKSLRHAGAGDVAFDCDANKTYSGNTLTSFTIGNATYTVASGCPHFVLYYKNPFGGYDHLLIEGAAKRLRTGSRDTFRADYDNRYSARETWAFQNEVTETWEVNTGLLTEDESSRMPYLMDSTDVFFCDLSAPSVFVPALIVTDSYTAETRNVKGMKMKNHTFQVKVAQNEYRR